MQPLGSANHFSQLIVLARLLIQSCFFFFFFATVRFCNILTTASFPGSHVWPGMRLILTVNLKLWMLFLICLHIHLLFTWKQKLLFSSTLLSVPFNSTASSISISIARHLRFWCNWPSTRRQLLITAFLTTLPLRDGWVKLLSYQSKRGRRGEGEEGSVGEETRRRERK